MSNTICIEMGSPASAFEREVLEMIYYRSASEIYLVCYANWYKCENPILDETKRYFSGRVCWILFYKLYMYLNLS